jgi:hypothetical protein
MALWNNRSARRLVFLLIWLALIDRFVPAVLASLEHDRYESIERLFRFEGSDLFGIGPVVAYLRDVPRGDHPRTVFMGNSVILGYKLETDQTASAAYQRLKPDTKVLNIAINNLAMGTSYLIARQVVDSVDTFVVLVSGTTALRTLPEMIDVDAADLERFDLPAVPYETALERRVRFWRLYHDAYRLQNALFGSSGRMYVYQNKAGFARALFRAVLRRPAATPTVDEPAAPTTTIDVRVPLASARPSAARLDALAKTYPLLWSFANLVKDHGKRGVFLDMLGYWTDVPEEDCADFNAHFAPNVAIVRVAVPTVLRMDTEHLTVEGSRALASALAATISAMDRRQ